jgi:hypothetical protein
MVKIALIWECALRISGEKELPFPDVEYSINKKDGK